MKLTHLEIENFRGIENLSINISDFISLVGPNNTGKSTIIRAIEILLNQVSPELSEWRNGHEDEAIKIIGIFDDIQDWERDTSGVSGLINENKIQLRARITRQDNKANPIAYDVFIKHVTIAGWPESDKWSELSDDIKAVAGSLDINGTSWKVGANKERVRQSLIENKPELVQFGEADWTDKSISISPALKQAIPQAVIVHAVKDASEDSKPAAKTSFGILLKRIVLPAIQNSDEYLTLIASVDALAAKVRATGDQQLETVAQLAETLSNKISSIIEAKVIFKLDPPDTDKFLGSNAGINLDDGTETPINQQGHGAQRALLFAMLEVLASQNAATDPEKTRSTILLFEEPEIYLHPHLMRRLKNALSEISSRPDWQVVISTHSPFFINVAENPKSLVILRKDDVSGNTVIKQLTNDPFVDDEGTAKDREALRATLDFHPTVTEAFFANRVVLVEGDTELSVLRHSNNIHLLSGVTQEQFDSTTIISCGGKWTIPAMVKMLSEFAIPFRVIHDCDRKGRTDVELETVTPIDPFRANQRIQEYANGAEIYVVNDTFEHVLWEGIDEVKASNKPYKAWKRVQGICTGETSLDDVPRLKEVIQFAYNW